MKHFLHWAVVFAVVSLCTTNVESAMVSPGQYLAAQSKPHFKQGHRLYWLGLGWPAPVAHNLTNIEDLTNWIPFGYAMSLGPYLTSEYVRRMASDSTNVFCKAIKLHNASPSQYPIAVCISKEFYVGPGVDPGNNQQQIDAMNPGTFLHDGSGNFILDGNGGKLWSPEGHEGWSDMGHARAEGLRALKNLGVQSCEGIWNTEEYPYPGICTDSTYCKQDPRVAAANGSMNWSNFTYFPLAGARLERIITDSVRSVFPEGKRQIYTPYNTMSVHKDRGARWPLDGGGWANPWTTYFGIGDLPAAEYYYAFGWGTYGFAYQPAWTSPSFRWDTPRLTTNEVAQEITMGYKNSYPWLATAQSEQNGYLPISSYMGYAKFLYTLGMLGGVIQDYSDSAGGVGTPTGLQFDESNPPHYMQSYIAHGHVHALFSHLDDFLLDGDLLPGPSVHDFSYDLPKYEFPVYEDVNIHVLARKKRTAEEWIVTAWLATDTLAGEAAGLNSRIVVSKKGNVTIPGIGAMTVNARNCGTVYLVKKIGGVMKMKLLDPDPNDPSNIPNDGAFVPVAAENLVAPTWDNVTSTIGIYTTGGYGNGATISPADIFENSGKGVGGGTVYPDLWFTRGSGSYNPLGFPYATNGVAMATIWISTTNVPVTVHYKVISGSATPGVDYQTLSDSVVFAAGDNMEYVVVKPIADADTTEGNETIQIQLQPGSQYTLGTDISVTGRIIDDKNPQATLVNIKSTVAMERPRVYCTGGILRALIPDGVRAITLFRPDGKRIYTVPVAQGQKSVRMSLKGIARGAILVRIEAQHRQETVVEKILF